MQIFKNMIKDLFVYHSPRDVENGFELLEDETEYENSTDGQDSKNKDDRQQNNSPNNSAGSRRGSQGSGSNQEESPKDINRDKEGGNKGNSGGSKRRSGEAEKSADSRKASDNNSGKNGDDDKENDSSKTQPGKKEEESKGQDKKNDAEPTEDSNPQSDSIPMGTTLSGEGRKNRRSKSVVVPYTVEELNEERQGGENESEQDSEEDNKRRRKSKNKDKDKDLRKVSSSLKENLDFIRRKFNLPDNQDIIIREFNIARRTKAALIFVDGMIDKKIVNQYTLPELLNPSNFEEMQDGSLLNYVEKNVLSINQITRMDEYEKIVPQILNGVTVLFVEGCDESLAIESRGYEKRGVDRPQTEAVINGSQEAFTENLRTNITLLRRIVKNENLITEIVPVSKTNNCNCAILYLNHIVNHKIVEEVKRRLNSLDVDFIEGSGMLEQFIEDKPFQLLPQIMNTERPDRVASFLMDGKVILICEGTPFALVVPVTFFHLFQTPEESNLRWQYGSFLRIVRLIGIITALLVPGMYIALTLYHQEMIPTSLLASIAASRESVPFPAILEIILMEISFELIREGGIRVPGIIGQTLGIIGALILGQAAVAAGLVSPILIIVVAISGLGSFTIPNYSLSLSIRILRFIFIFFGGIAGFYGISVCLAINCVLALSIKSFGVPFFAPFSPKTRAKRSEVLKYPAYTQEERVDYLNSQNRRRMADEPRAWVTEEGDDDSYDT